MENDAVTLLPSLMRNIDIFRARMGAPQNADVIVRRFRAGAFEAAIIAIDGMTDDKTLNENLLKPCMDLPETAGAQVLREERVAFLMAHAVSVLPMKMKDNIDEILGDVLSGQSALLCEGCAQACVMDTRGFEKRSIGRPEAEKVVLGAHESFSESIRTSITLIRRIVQREELTTEFLSVGGKMKTRCALLYLRGTADEETLARIRRRLMACQSDFPLTAGQLEQVIERHPLALIPQCVRTERPDRAASFLAEGQILLLTDGSPEAIGAPATLYHQLNTPDDASMRWQYGTFLRAVRLVGVLIHLFLPGLYLAVLRFHPELLSAMLLTSVYETSSRVPFPVFLEALLMTLAFDLISEAGLRAPGALGNALGIVSGLILGQSAVSADIVSPLLLIVVAASGLGGFCVPSYALGVGLKIVQLMMMVAGACGGLYAIALLTLALLCLTCAMTSLGSPLTAPLSPARPRNPDLLLRLPLAFQRARAFFSRERSADVRRARVRASFRARACAAGLCVGVQTFALGAGVAMTLSLNAAWLGALSVLPAAAAVVALCRSRLVAAPGATSPARASLLLLALTMAICAAFSLGALINLAEQTFLSQARTIFILLTALSFFLLGAIGGTTGAARAAFFLRYAGVLAALVPLLRSAVAHAGVGGLFPLLGAGGKMLALSLLVMLSAAAPALMLLLPPEHVKDFSPQDVPGTGFFLWRVLLGAALGIALLLALSLGSNYETIAASTTWGQRLRLSGANGAHGGLLFAALTLMQLALLLTQAINMLLCGAQALRIAFPKALAGWRAGALLALPIALSLVGFMLFGFDVLLAVAALCAVPAGLALIRRHYAP